MTRQKKSTEKHIFKDDRSVELFARIITMRNNPDVAHSAKVVMMALNYLRYLITSPPAVSLFYCNERDSN